MQDPSKTAWFLFRCLAGAVFMFPGLGRLSSCPPSYVLSVKEDWSSGATGIDLNKYKKKYTSSYFMSEIREFQILLI